MKWLAITDEYTRECLALEVDRSITADQRAGHSDEPVSHPRRAEAHPQRQRPGVHRPAIRRHAEQAGLEMLYIEPGSPVGERLRGIVLQPAAGRATEVEEFMNLAEARWFARRRLQEHNEERPHSSLGYQTPAEFAAQLCSLPLRLAYAPAPLQQQTAGIYRYPTRTLITPGTKNGGSSVGTGAGRRTSQVRQASFRQIPR